MCNYYACVLAIECPPGAVYQQCGSLCPRTCDSNDAASCPSGCAEGCFCSEGLVSHNGTCVDVSVCPGTYVHMCMVTIVIIRIVHLHFFNYVHT